MQFQVTEIEFDFTGAEDEISEQEMKNITEEVYRDWLCSYRDWEHSQSR